jgi:hypothetical protein
VRTVGEDGKLKEASQQYALSYLLKQCTDFKEEKSDLEHLATELSGHDTTISILFMPKYHCKLAGEGIEYCWGAAKQIVVLSSCGFRGRLLAGMIQEDG